MATQKTLWNPSARYGATRQRIFCRLLKPLGWLALPMVSLSLACHAITPALLWIAYLLLLDRIMRNLYRPVLPQERIGPMVIHYARSAEQAASGECLFPGERLKLANTAHGVGLLTGAMLAATTLCFGWAVPAAAAAGGGIYILLYLLARLDGAAGPAEGAAMERASGDGQALLISISAGSPRHSPCRAGKGCVV
ncbi:MAG TPA: hypothetical protein VKU00_30335 [Chthonomonadaceae bacterium]|nr:hypothetical protein [Chthonomonadaceae bacterium]